jgi:hypothetical protein
VLIEFTYGGAGSYEFRPIHAHILVVGWLSVFSWGVFYKLFEVKYPKLITVHGWSAILGAIGLTVGMWLNLCNRLDYLKRSHSYFT